MLEPFNLLPKSVTFKAELYYCIETGLFFAVVLASVGFGEKFKETHDDLLSRKPFSPSPHPRSPRKILEERSKKPKGSKYVGGFFFFPPC